MSTSMNIQGDSLSDPSIAPSLAENGGPGKILVVDDEPAVIDVIKQFLECYVGMFVIEIAMSGEEAFRKMVRFSPNVVVLDFNLPDMTGIEILKQIQFLRPNAHVVMLTGHSNDSLRKEAFREGAIRYLEKPIVLTDFVKLMVHLCRTPRASMGGLEGGDMDVVDLLQLMHMCRKRASINFINGRKRSMMRFDNGQLLYADDGSLEGEKAIFNMALMWNSGHFYTLPEEMNEILEPNCTLSTEQIIMQCVMLRDRAGTEAGRLEHQNGVGQDQSEPLVEVSDIAAAIPEPVLEAQMSLDTDEPDLSDLVPNAISEDPRPTVKLLPDANLEFTNIASEAVHQLLNVDVIRTVVMLTWGGVIIAGKSKERKTPLEAIGTVLATNVGSIQALGREWLLGNSDMVVLEFDLGNVMARAVGQHGFLVVVSEAKANPGLVRSKLIQQAIEIERRMLL
jgi:CheY-like chemotaxis protein